MLHDWQYCKEDPIPSREFFVEKLYNTKIYINLAEKICASQPFLLISDKFDRVSIEKLSISGKKGQCNYRKANINKPFMTMPNFSIISATTPSITTPAFLHLLLLPLSK